jgi:hypothetical protein
MFRTIRKAACLTARDGIAIIPATNANASDQARKQDQSKNHCHSVQFNLALPSGIATSFIYGGYRLLLIK